jgi:cobaltochelatase CobT
MTYAHARAPSSPVQGRAPASASSIQDASRLRKAQNRYRSMVIFTKMLGLTWNIDIIFDPNVSTACTDKKSIRLRPCSIGDEEDVILMEGLLDHEAGVHCRQTDFDLLNRWAPTVPDITKNIWNICEDVWGERELYRVKPGCARTIKATLELLVKRGLYGAPSPDLHPSATLVNGLLGGLRSTRLNQSILKDFYEQNWALAEKHFGLELSGKIWTVAQDIDRVGNTAGAMSIAERISQLLRDYLQEPPPPPPPPPQPSSGSDEESEDESDDEDQDGEPDQNGSQGSSGDASDDASDNDSGDSGTQSSSGNGGNSGDNDQEPSSGSSGSTGNDDASAAPQNGSGNGTDSDSNPPGSQDQADGSDPSDDSGSSSQSSASGSQPQADQAGEPGSNGSKQARSVVSDPGQKPGTDPKAQGTPATDTPTSAPDQKPIDSNKNDTGPSNDQGNAAPQPAPMTPEEFHNALRAVKATLDADSSDSGTGELGDAISDALGDSKAPAQARALGISAGNSWDLGSSKLAPNPSVDAVISEISRPIAVRLGSKLDALLEAQTTANTYTKRQGRRIAAGKLVGLMTTGNQRIFKASDDVEQLDTVVQIVTDISASMTAPLGEVGSVGQGSRPVTRIGAAASCTRALGDVLSRFDVPFGINYFGSCRTTLKKYDDNWRTRKELYWTSLESSTCTDQALIGVIPELAARTEERKLLVLITDGVPAHAQAAALALSEATKLGIDCCVVIVTSKGVADTSLKAFKDALDKFGISHATATAVDELAQTIFDAVKQAL